MENTNRDTAHDAAPQNEWLHADEPLQAVPLTPEEEALLDAETENYDDSPNEYLFANDDPDDEDEDEEDEDDEKGDWGHVDPAEGNSPFPDPMDPAAPGSAV